MVEELPDWMKADETDWGDAVSENLPGFKFYNDTITIHFDPGKHVYYKFDEDGVRQDIDGVTTVLGVISKPFLVPWATKLCIETLKSHMLTPEGAIKSFSTEDLHQWFQEAKNKHRERLETAGDIGHMAHDCLEKSIQHAIDHTKGVVLELKDIPTNQMAHNCALAGWDWMKRHNVRWIATERKVYSRLFNVAGTEDGVCIVDSCDDLECCRGRVFKDRKAISDWKSSNQLSDSYAYQVAIYQFAQIEEFGTYIPDRWVLRLGKEDGKFEPWYLPAEYFEADLNAFLAALELYRSLKGITERRKVDDAELRFIIKTRKKAEKATADEVIRLEKLAAKVAAKAAREELKAKQDAHYKQLRADKVPAAEAKLLAYPPKPIKEVTEPEVVTPAVVDEEPFVDEGWSIKL